MLVLAGIFAARARSATVTDLGEFVPNGLSNNNIVVGDILVEPNEMTSSTHAAVWSNGTLTPLPERAGTSESEAYAVNEAGRAVGLEYVDGNNVHAVYWDGVAGLPTQIGPLAGDADFSQAEDVDAAGDVAGSTSMFVTGAPHVVVGYYAPAGGSPIPVGVGNLDADGGNSRVGAMTSDGAMLLGEVLGTISADGYYLWSSVSPGAAGIKLDITPGTSGFKFLTGSTYSLLLIQNDLANDGSVLGFKGAGLSRTWYVRTPDGAETQIVGLTAHNAINASHTVVGTMYTGDPLDPIRAAMWDPNTQTVTDLNTLLPPDSGFILFDALAINDNGDIAGVAFHNGTQVGFLLTLSCSIKLETTEEDPRTGTIFNSDDLTLTKPAGDSSAPQGSGYPPGGT